MRKWSRAACLFLALAVLVPAVPAEAAAAGFYLGNSDINITNGGVMLSYNGECYYSENGIHRDSDSDSVLLCSDDAKNLNYADGYIYYTIGAQVRRVPASGGAAETVFSNPASIDQMYVVCGTELRFLSGGSVYSYSMTSGKLSSPMGTGIVSLIPTVYGNILLTGEVFDYTIIINGSSALKGVAGCYTDGGYLAVTLGSDNYQVRLERLFSGFNAGVDLEEFNIHGTVDAVSLFHLDDGAYVCEECERNAAAHLFTVAELLDEPAEPFIEPAVSQGQLNMVKRARQQHEIQWTPLEDRYQWGYRGVFNAETTYTGLPYGQPVNTGYVPWSVTYSSFLDYVNDNTSSFYTKYSEYNKIAPAYSCDCSSFVSTAWGTKQRYTTYSLPSVAEKVSDQSIYSLQVGDCLNHSTSHVVLVSAVRYDESGKMTSVDIMEQTPVITKKTRYGEGGTGTLAQLQSYYLGGGYVIYRNPDRDSVQYTHDCAVPLDGDYCSGCKETQPLSKTTGFIGGKTVTLSHSDTNAVIYYTTDGSSPTASSPVYSSPLTFYGTAKLRAIAVTGNFSVSRILEYTVKVPPAEAPAAEVASGVSSGDVISAGSTIELKTASSGATIYYTTDGSTPTASSRKYTGPITVNSDMTIKAFCQASGMTDSAVSVFTYKTGKVFAINVTAGTGGSISPSGSVGVLETTSKTFAVTAGSGYKIEDVKVDGSSVGAVSSYTFENISSGHTISASFKETTELPFADVKDGDWFQSAVSTVYKQGLFSGTSTTEFSPDATMTRGMFVTVLGRLAGISSGLSSGVGIVTGDGVRIRSQATTESEILAVVNRYTAVQVISVSGDWHKVQYGSVTGYIRNDLISSDSVKYMDVNSGMYYAPYIEWATLSGIASGTGSDTFSPNTNITREQMCVMLYNYTQKYGVSLANTAGQEAFADDASLSSYAKEAVYALQKAGVISGMGNGKFEPLNSANRAQVAQIMTNFLLAAGR